METKLPRNVSILNGLEYNKIRSQYSSINDKDVKTFFDTNLTFNGYLDIESQRSSEQLALSANDNYLEMFNESNFIIKITSKDKKYCKNICIERSSKDYVNIGKFNCNMKYVLTSTKSVVILNSLPGVLLAYFFRTSGLQIIKLKVDNHQLKRKFVLKDNCLLDINTKENNLTLFDFHADKAIERTLNMDGWVNNISLFVELHLSELRSNDKINAIEVDFPNTEDLNTNRFVIHQNFIVTLKDSFIKFFSNDHHKWSLVKTINLSSITKSYCSHEYDIRYHSVAKSIVYLLCYCPADSKWLFISTDMKTMTVFDIVEFIPKNRRPYINMIILSDNHIIIKESFDNTVHKIKTLYHVNSLYSLTSCCIRNHISSKDVPSLNLPLKLKQSIYGTSAVNY